MLPRPCLSITLPSVHDSTQLDCRIYHPSYLRDPSRTDVQWLGHAAVVAHPYAPMGGCFDDPIVDVAAGTLLQLGFLVVTFNFRGAGKTGRTSWTSRPEQADYVSVVGFLACYVHHLSKDPLLSRHLQGEVPGAMLLAGYSYGAMIATRLPPLDTMLSYFATPALHTAEADIRLRAQHLAEAHMHEFASPDSSHTCQGAGVGGEEVFSRVSRDEQLIPDSHREECIKDGVKRLLSCAPLVNRKPSSWSSNGSGCDDKARDCLQPVQGDISFRSAYLAISPPVGLVTRLVTMSFSPGGSISLDGAMFTSNPTLVVYGDQDSFINHKKMREWTRQLSGAGASQFRCVAVSGAGHFWVEEGVYYKLRDTISTFTSELIQNDMGMQKQQVPNTVARGVDCCNNKTTSDG
ncbi:Alpha/Beta hydrolase protein [Astrocystis sublimbata]|nr:Alpha/Beta hydrolase protein [Astrocystis sublimbata]